MNELVPGTLVQAITLVYVYDSFEFHVRDSSYIRAGHMIFVVAAYEWCIDTSKCFVVHERGTGWVYFGPHSFIIMDR
jgi:hypothetical protein